MSKTKLLKSDPLEYNKVTKLENSFYLVNSSVFSYSHFLSQGILVLV